MLLLFIVHTHYSNKKLFFTFQTAVTVLLIVFIIILPFEEINFIHLVLSKFYYICLKLKTDIWKMLVLCYDQIGVRCFNYVRIKRPLKSRRRVQRLAGIPGRGLDLRGFVTGITAQTGLLGEKSFSTTKCTDCIARGVKMALCSCRIISAVNVFNGDGEKPAPHGVSVTPWGRTVTTRKKGWRRRADVSHAWTDDPSRCSRYWGT